MFLMFGHLEVSLFSFLSFFLTFMRKLQEKANVWGWVWGGGPLVCTNECKGPKDWLLIKRGLKITAAY